VVSAGKEGDSQKEMVLTEARAMVVREYLVENYGFEDSQLKTLGMGKQAETNSDGDWGIVQIFIYPAGAAIPRVIAAANGDLLVTKLGPICSRAKRSGTDSIAAGAAII